LKKKLFIFGVGSLTGSKLAILAKNDFEVFGSFNLRCPNLDFIKSAQLDIKNFKKAKELLSTTNPDFVVNTCAINNVDYCENHREESKLINTDFVENIVNVVDSLGSKLIHLSSDSVFDGKKELPYVEEDFPKPINFYGYTKMLSEQYVLKNTKNLIVRVSVLYGWLIKSLQDKPSSSMKAENFGMWVIKKLIAQENIKIITDEYSSPIIADDFANVILHLIKGNYAGIYHAAPPIKINRYEFALEIAKKLDLNSNLILPVTAKELGRKVDTGINKCLDSTKVSKTKFKFMSLADSLKLLKHQMFEGST